MEHLPLYISIVFILTVAAVIFIFYLATKRNKTVLGIIMAWLLLQGIIAGSGFYTKTNTFPPRFSLAVLPAFLFIAVLLLNSKGRKFVSGLPTGMLTLIHVIRIPVEIILLWLCMYKVVPQVMTFGGRNFDIFSGISAIAVYYTMYYKNRFNRTVLLIWNFTCLLLLVNIVATAVLAAPFSFQKMAFDQPNIAILYMPFVWLPSVIVPIVLLAHIASIKQLLKQEKEEAFALQPKPID